MTVIKQCSCEHKFQDKVYGKGNRVFNDYKKPEPGGFRCTVCGKDTKK